MGLINFEGWTIVQSEAVKNQENPIVFIGCMTGTSADTTADFTPAIFDEDGMPIAYINLADQIPSDLQDELYTLSTSDAENIAIKKRSEIEAALTEYLIGAFARILEQAGLSDYSKENIVLSPHGQTVDHKPLANPPYTDILLNAERLAEKTGCRVVSRHRQMPLVVSMAAPLAPVLIFKLFYSSKKNRVLLNGGGVANICVLQKDHPNKLIGFDTGPANGPIDALIHYILDNAVDKIPSDLLPEIQSKKCDVDGKLAVRGEVIPELIEHLLGHEFFKRNLTQKSADRSDFTLQWIFEFTKGKKYDWVDILTTVSEVVAKTIADSIVVSIPGDQGQTEVEVVMYGGLSYNQHVIRRIKEYLHHGGNFKFTPMSQFGYDPNYFESLLMAYLGYCAYYHVPIDLSYCAREGYERPMAIPGTVTVPSSISIQKSLEALTEPGSK